MTDGPALLAAILANPDEDTPRLMYADWLDENGQPERAEFIRVQIEKYSLQSEQGSPEWCRSFQREEELWQALGKSFDLPPRFHSRLPWEKCEDGESGICVISRGFPATVACSLLDWLAQGPEIVTRHPVETVRLTDREPDLPPISSPDLGFRWVWAAAEVRLSEVRARTAATQASWLRERRERRRIPLAIYRHGCSGRFATTEAANAVLSRGCIAWAKAEAAANVMETILNHRRKDGPK